MEGDSLGTAAWNWAMGAAMKGVPGHVTGTNLSERIGMPNLWFRGSGRDLEGQDLLNHYLGEMLGPVAGIASGAAYGATLLAQGDWMRASERLLPGFAAKPIKAGRYATEGVLTRNGDVIMEDVSARDVLVQAIGFTPARLAERYKINNRLKNEENRILTQRRALHREATDAIRAGDGLSARVLERISRFNRAYPEYPITAQTIRQSLQGRLRASERNEFGTQLNQRLNDRIRGNRAVAIYN